jgi:exonuclease III
MAKFIKIDLWNANGLAQHKDEVETFLDNNAIDILLVSETHFTDRSEQELTKKYAANTPFNPESHRGAC